MKRLIALAVIIATLLSLCACGSSSNSTSSSKNGSTSSSAAGQYLLPSATTPTSRTTDEVGFQLNAPKIGEKVVVLETSMGDIVIRMFPESAPKAVENFMTHADNGYYNGLKFHRVIKDFMIQGGDPKGDGTGSESIWGEDFEDEFNANLLNLRGSIAMANSGVNTNGSQFFINQVSTCAYGKNDFDISAYFGQMLQNTQNITYLTQMYNSDAAARAEFATVEEFISNYIYEYVADTAFDPRKVPDKVWELYGKYGGNISLDGAWKATKGHTVFGQVVIGMGIVDDIAAVATDSSDKPKLDIIIEKAYTTTFTEAMQSGLDEYIVK